MTRLWTPRADGALNEGGSLTDRVLAARGITDPAAVTAFLNPQLRSLHDPSTLPGLDAAAERLLRAVRDGEPVVIYGDYDVDGITATAILFHTLRTIRPDADVRTYVPHRLEEGYGLNSDAVRSLADQGARVVVSVDCGITAVGPAQTARELGVDLIITDHHNPPADSDPMPDALLVHPRLPGSAYPFGELCGAGVAYKLAWRLATLDAGGDRASEQMRTLLIDLLALAALGTVADVVPLLDENRVLTRFGLARCKHSPLIGLRALVSASGLDGEAIDAEGVGFKLGPRLNACGRMGHADQAVELFTTDDPDRAAEIAAELCRLNDSRRATERTIVDQAAEMAESAGMTGADRRAIVLAHEDWHPGVVGIVCSRLVERFARPAILMQIKPGEDGPVCAGSGRSIDGFNLHAGLRSCADLLTSFGGHDAAAGLALPAENLGPFTDAFITEANARLRPEDLVRTAAFDCDAQLAELTPGSVGELDRLGPFGRSNPPVTIRVRRARITEIRTMGQRQNHAALRLECDGRAVRTVAWNWAERLSEQKLAVGERVDALLSPKLSTWQGSTRVEPELIDLRRADIAGDAEIVVKTSRLTGAAN